LDKIAGILLIALLAIVAAVSISYYALNQPNQNSNEPSPTPTPTPTLVPNQTPTPTPQIKTPADLVVDCTLKIDWEDGVPGLKVLGSITNVGEETAYNVTIHVRTWFSNGTEAITIDHKLNLYHGLVPSYPVDIEGGETYSAGTLVGHTNFDIPYEIWKDWPQWYVDNDCISTYQVTASWDD
jgi:hypothetical protein